MNGAVHVSVVVSALLAELAACGGAELVDVVERTPAPELAPVPAYPELGALPPASRPRIARELASAARARLRRPQTYTRRRWRWQG